MFKSAIEHNRAVATVQPRSLAEAPAERPKHLRSGGARCDLHGKHYSRHGKTYSRQPHQQQNMDKGTRPPPPDPSATLNFLKCLETQGSMPAG